MSKEIVGHGATQSRGKFHEVSDPHFFDAEAEDDGTQIYLDSVLPQSYDPTLEPWNSFSLRPKEYPQQTEDGFHPSFGNPYEYNFNNSNKYFFPQNRGQVI